MPVDRKHLTSTALLAVDRSRRQSVSVHTKLTYKLLPSGRCVRAEKQQPFLFPAEDNPDIPDSDLIPYKTATDLIIMASAHAPRDRARTMTASVEVGALERQYRVFGDRVCSYKPGGSITFSPPAPFERIPLRFEFAYGGFDPTVAPTQPQTLLDVFNPHPGVYPRNPVGRGYVVHRDAQRIEGLLLPNIEHPEELLTPQNLVAGGPENWWKQPLPWSCDWFDKGWYPRCTFLGGVPDHLPEDDRGVKEVRLGWVDPFQNRREREGELGDLIDFRFGNAASPGLVLPFLKGNEEIRLRGMTPAGEIVVGLPGEVPRMRVRFEGRTHEVVPVPNRILISTEEMGVYIVWHGAWPTPRPLPDRLPQRGDSLAQEMEGIEVEVDSRPVPPLDDPSRAQE